MVTANLLILDLQRKSLLIQHIELILFVELQNTWRPKFYYTKVTIVYRINKKGTDFVLKCEAVQ